MAVNQFDGARERLIQLSEDPAICRYVIGYLLGCLNERYWSALVANALDHADSLKALEIERSKGMDKTGV